MPRHVKRTLLDEPSIVAVRCPDDRGGRSLGGPWACV